LRFTVCRVGFFGWFFWFAWLVSSVRRFCVYVAGLFTLRFIWFPLVLGLVRGLVLAVYGSVGWFLFLRFRLVRFRVRGLRSVLGFVWFFTVCVPLVTVGCYGLHHARLVRLRFTVRSAVTVPGYRLVPLPRCVWLDTVLVPLWFTPRDGSGSGS
jgi:hypothetical protein